MLRKATIVWAAAFGAVAAVGAGGVVWRLHGAAPPAPVTSAPRSIDVAGASSVEAPSVPAPDASPAAATPTQSKPAEQTDGPRPQFDIVRVEPSGEAVIAGHAAPKAKIAVTDHGAIVAEADADETGQFVVLPPAFKPGGHALGLTARVGEGAPVQSPGVVGVDVPEPTQAAAASKAAAPAAPAEPPKTVAAAAPATPKPAPPQVVSRKLVTAAAQPAANSSALQNSTVRGETAKPASPNAARTGVVAMAAPTLSDSAAAKAAAATAADISKQTEAPKADPAMAPSPAAKPAEPVLLAKSEAAAPAGAAPRTAITGVAANEAGRMVTTGVAAPGALLRLYLNGSFLASVTASVKGTWSLTVEQGMTGGAYAIRADEIDRGKGAVVSRAEVPFNYPQQVAEMATVAKPAASTETVVAPPAAPSEQPKAKGATVVASAGPQPALAAQSRALSVAAHANSPPAASTAVQRPAAPTLVASASLTDATVQSAAPKPASASGEGQAGAPPPEPASNVVVKLIDTHKVVPGDNLWDISQHVYGDGLRYTQIYAANSNQIRNPRLIYPGQIFVLPQATPF